jgi:hypothetical protein
VGLVWVTGNSGAGKSTVCDFLKSLGERAIDADWEGFSRWVDRAEVQVLAGSAHDQTAFLCGSAENEADVRDLFDLMICLVVDGQTLRDRLRGRTTNAFGQHPEELAAALETNDDVESAYRRLGATIINGRLPLPEIADAILAAAARSAPGVRPG